ncbi:MAG: HepT-like ribonuclease domain-containing protein [Clostridia bacterium]|nr:HepT-like ribonuclease domain-containing protein [Clostridia bacterium]
MALRNPQPVSIGRFHEVRSVGEVCKILVLNRMAGYRNHLVHLYHQATVEEPYHIVSENLDGFRAFSDSIRGRCGTRRRDRWLEESAV